MKSFVLSRMSPKLACSERNEAEEPAPPPGKKQRREIPDGVSAAVRQCWEDAVLQYHTANRYWHGLDHITSIVTFGDSTTSHGDDETWLRHFLKSVNPSRDSSAPPMKAYNYAIAGDTVEDDFSDQIIRFFGQHPKKNSAKAKASLDPVHTLYVIWLGTNDCGRTGTDDLEEIIDALFTDGLDELYVKAGARNFLLIDVPPKHRSPQALEQSVDLEERFLTWNKHLRSKAQTYASDNQQASVFVFSSWAIISAVLDDPSEYDFQEDDLTEEGGSIWLDELHLTSGVHAIIAGRLRDELCTA